MSQPISVQDITKKYLRVHPDDWHSTFHKPIMTNVDSAYHKFGYALVGFNVNVVAIIEYEWEGDTTIYF